MLHVTASLPLQFAQEGTDLVLAYIHWSHVEFAICDVLDVLH